MAGLAEIVNSLNSRFCFFGPARNGHWTLVAGFVVLCQLVLSRFNGRDVFWAGATNDECCSFG